MHRMIYLILGWIAVALGAIGVLLPVLPTTPFILLAAFLFGKGSPRARAWLIEHAHFGPLIQDWERSGAIAPKYKAIACGMMGVTFAASWYFGVKPFVLVIQAVSLGGAAWFVLSRPNGPADIMSETPEDITSPGQ